MSDQPLKENFTISAKPGDYVYTAAGAVYIPIKGNRDDVMVELEFEGGMTALHEKNYFHEEDAETPLDDLWIFLQNAYLNDLNIADEPVMSEFEDLLEAAEKELADMRQGANFDDLAEMVHQNKFLNAIAIVKDIWDDVYEEVDNLPAPGAKGPQ